MECSKYAADIYHAFDSVLPTTQPFDSSPAGVSLLGSVQVGFLGRNSARFFGRPGLLVFGRSDVGLRRRGLPRFLGKTLTRCVPGGFQETAPAAFSMGYSCVIMHRITWVL